MTGRAIENYCFDIETAPLDDSVLDLIIPPFNPDEVKVGNMGAEKAKEKIDRLRKEHFKNYRQRAALSPLTSQVAAIGIIGPAPDERAIMIDPNESELIKTFFDLFIESIRSPRITHWIGYNIAAFDIPFLVKRAWKLGLHVPDSLVHGRYLSAWFTDLAVLWRLSDYRAAIPSLSELATFFGLPAKAHSGADFAELLRYDYAEAQRYLSNDLALTWEIASRLNAFLERREVPPQEHHCDPEPVEPELRFY